MDLNEWLWVRDKCRQKIADDKKRDFEELLKGYNLKKGKEEAKVKFRKYKGWDDCVEIDITESTKELKDE